MLRQFFVLYQAGPSDTAHNLLPPIDLAVPNLDHASALIVEAPEWPALLPTAFTIPVVTGTIRVGEVRLPRLVLYENMAEY